MARRRDRWFEAKTALSTRARTPAESVWGQRPTDETMALDILNANIPTAAPAPVAPRPKKATEPTVAELPLRPNREFPPDAPRPEEEYGATGTPNFGGFISGEDYNPRLDGAKALLQYDEVRRSDARASAMLRIIKLPLLGSGLDIDPPVGSTDRQDQAIADFCASALFDQDAMTRPWADAFKHILLKFDFGCSLLEKVFTVGELGEIRYQRLAPRLPRTVFRWIVDPQTGVLESVVQFAPKGGAYQYLTIPSRYVGTFINDQEGDNYFGRSIFRSAYQHWWRKQQLYNLGSVKLDRYGVGIPKATIEKGHRPTDLELQKIQKILKGLRSAEHGYLIEPPGVTFDILVPQGAKGGDDGLMDLINHHDFMMADSILAGFMSSSQKKGSLAHTTTLAEMFEDFMSAIGADLGAEVQSQLVRPLCDLNFDMTNRKYPVVRISGLDSTDFGALATAVQKLGPTPGNVRGFLTPDDDTEDWLRKQAGAPPRIPTPVLQSDATPGAGGATGGTDSDAPARAAPSASPAAASSATRTTPLAVPKSPVPDPNGDTGGSVVAVPNKTPGQPSAGSPTDVNLDPTTGQQPLARSVSTAGGPGKLAPQPQPRPQNPTGQMRPKLPSSATGGQQGVPPLAQDTRLGNNDGYPLSMRADPVVIDGRTFSRPPTDLENQVLNFREIPSRLDYEKDALVRALHAIRVKQRDALIADIVSRDAGNTTGSLTELRPDKTVLPFASQVYAAIRASQKRMAQYGASQVQAELQKQGVKPKPVSLKDPEPAVNPAAKAGAGKQSQISSLVSSAQTTAQQLNQQWQQKVLQAAITIRKTGVQGDALAKALSDDLDDAAVDTGLARAAGQEVNEAFGLGRQTEAAANQDVLTGVTRSALMDANTCPHCQAMDGTEWDPDDADIVDTPDPDCDGGDACRCVNLYLAKGE